MTPLFQTRGEADYGTAIVKYNAPDRDQETKILYLMGRAPNKYIEKFKDAPEWRAFLKSKNIPADAPLEKLSAAAAIELAGRIVDDEMIKRLTDNVIADIEAHPEKTFKSVRVVVPFPVNAEATKNNFAPALAAAVTVALEAKLSQALESKGMGTLDVVADLDATKSSRTESILNVVDNQRGNPDHQVAYAKALEAVGGTVDETKGNSAHDIFRYPAGTLKGLETIFENTLENRLLMVGQGDQRYQNLVASGRVANYTGAAL